MRLAHTWNTRHCSFSRKPHLVEGEGMDGWMDGGREGGREEGGRKKEEGEEGRE